MGQGQEQSVSRERGVVGVDLGRRLAPRGVVVARVERGLERQGEEQDGSAEAHGDRGERRGDEAASGPLANDRRNPSRIIGSSAVIRPSRTTISRSA